MLLRVVEGLPVGPRLQDLGHRPLPHHLIGAFPHRLGGHCRHQSPLPHRQGDGSGRRRGLVRQRLGSLLEDRDVGRLVGAGGAAALVGSGIQKLLVTQVLLLQGFVAHLVAGLLAHQLVHALGRHRHASPIREPNTLA